MTKISDAYSAWDVIKNEKTRNANTAPRIGTAGGKILDAVQEVANNVSGIQLHVNALGTEFATLQSEIENKAPADDDYGYLPVYAVDDHNNISLILYENVLVSPDQLKDTEGRGLSANDFTDEDALALNEFSLISIAQNERYGTIGIQIPGTYVDNISMKPGSTVIYGAAGFVAVDEQGITVYGQLKDTDGRGLSANDLTDDLVQEIENASNLVDNIMYGIVSVPNADTAGRVSADGYVGGVSVGRISDMSVIIDGLQYGQIEIYQATNATHATNADFAYSIAVVGSLSVERVEEMSSLVEGMQYGQIDVYQAQNSWWADACAYANSTGNATYLSEDGTWGEIDYNRISWINDQVQGLIYGFVSINNAYHADSASVADYAYMFYGDVVLKQNTQTDEVLQNPDQLPGTPNYVYVEMGGFMVKMSKSSFKSWLNS